MLAIARHLPLHCRGGRLRSRPARSTHLARLANPDPNQPPSAALPHGLKMNQVRYVLSAAEQGSFRRAASVLNIQQSTISRRIRELEDRLGAPIFERGVGGVRLTTAGGRFVERARQAAAHLADAADLMGAVGRADQKVLRLGLMAPLGGGFLDRLLAAILARRPAVDLGIVEGGAADHLAALDAGRLDLAFLPIGIPAGRRGARPLWRDPWMLVLPAHHRLASRTRIARTDLVGCRVAAPGGGLADAAAAMLRRLGLEAATGPEGRRPTASANTLMRLAALGQGLPIVLASAATALPAGLVARPLTCAPLIFQAVWSPRNGKPALRRLLALATELADPEWAIRSGDRCGGRG